MREQRPVDLDGDGVNELVVTAVSPLLTSGAPVDACAENVLVLAWDPAARRWTSVFDAARHPLSAPAHLSTLSLTVPRFIAEDPAQDPAQTLAPGAGTGGTGGGFDTDITTATLRRPDGAGADLVLGVTRGMADGPYTTVSVVRYVEQLARVVHHAEAETWQVLEPDAGSPGGAAGRQRLQLTAPLHAAGDAMCCPLRDYTLEVAPRPLVPAAPSGAGGPGQQRGHEDGEEYEVVDDDRPWVGAYALAPPDTSDGRVLVVAVVPGSPADGVLQVADVLEDVDAVPTPAADGDGAAVLHELASLSPGERVRLLVRRDGQRIGVSLTTSALSSPTAPSTYRAPGLDPSRFGISLATTGGGAESGGALLSGVTVDGPAAVAGLTSGDTITSIGRLQVRRNEDVLAAGFRFAPLTEVEVGYRNAYGEAHTTRLTTAPVADDLPVVVAVL